MTNIILREWLVCGSYVLAAIPVGCSVNYPNVLLHQLASNDSSIPIDWDTASWIGSIHGIAGIPSIIMPAFMQWRGRKLAFILACLVSIIGWIITFTATNVMSILIGESLHGFGVQSILTVGMLSMSEMLSSHTRKLSIALYLILQALGMALVGIMGSYLHWKTVSMIVCAPLAIVIVIVATVWPESPSWLAYKGEFTKCAKAFALLRGTGELAETELKELILAQKENYSRDQIKRNRRHIINNFWHTLKSRDFYLPLIHILISLISLYWNGSLPCLVYSSLIIDEVTTIENAKVIGNVVMNIMFFTGCITSSFLIRFFKPKKLLLVTALSSMVCLLIASLISYLQFLGIMSKESYICLYFLLAYMFIFNSGSPVVVAITAELIPVKHRGIGGPLYVIMVCLMHTSSLKLAPYIFRYIYVWGGFILFAINGVVSNLYIWKYIPDTHGKTLQQVEDYYAYGDMDKHRKVDQEVALSELMPVKDPN